MHTSSVDFCEENYFVSKHVAEFHNTWSSLIMIFPALVGLIYANPTKEWRFTIMFLTLAVVFAGSILLHSSLEAIQQSLDEVPMLWLNNMLLFSLMELNAPKGKPIHKHLGIFMVLGCLVETVMYYSFRYLYVVFLATFIPLTVVVTFWTGKLAFFSKNVSPIARQLYVVSTVCYTVIGSPLWIVEMNFCQHLLPLFRMAGGMTFHILWHIGAGLGAYFMIMFLIAMRVEALGGSVGLKHVLYVFPVVFDSSTVSVKKADPINQDSKLVTKSPAAKAVSATRAKSPAAKVSEASRAKSPAAKVSEASRAKSPAAKVSNASRAKSPAAKATDASRAKSPAAKAVAATRAKSPAAKATSTSRRSKSPGASQTRISKSAETPSERRSSRTSKPKKMD